MNFSPCLDIFFSSDPFTERMRKTAELGFGHFEFWSWWDKDVPSIVQSQNELETHTAALCTRFVSLTDATKRDEYLRGLEETIEVALQLKCRTVISQVGAEQPDRTREEQTRSIIDGLKASARLLEKTQIKLVIEPLNTIYDHKGYFLTRSDDAAKIVESVGSSHVGMLFDIYHQQVSEGNLIGNLRRFSKMIGHIHVADCPGRHEIGSGEINYANVLEELKRLEYQGCVGIELFPADPDHRKALSNPLFR